VLSCLGAGLNVLNLSSVLFEESLDILSPHDPIVLQIAFVAHQQYLGFWRTRIFDFCVPVRNGILKGLFISDVEDNHECVCAPVVWARDGSEALMASRIPNLELDLIAIERKRLEPEVNADGRQEDLAELIICVSHYYRWLSDARVAHQDNLEEIVVFSLTL
jgi:hypothetical protein